jgi:hypothetical protein
MNQTEHDWLEQVVAAEVGSPVAAGGLAVDPSQRPRVTTRRSPWFFLTTALTEAFVVVIAYALWAGIVTAIDWFRQFLRVTTTGDGGLVDSYFVPALQIVSGLTLLIIVVVHLLETVLVCYHEFRLTVRQFAFDRKAEHTTST